MAAQYFVMQVMTGDESPYISLARTQLRIHALEARLWWPRRKLTIRRRGRRMQSLAPLFPGYVVLETEELTRDLYSTLRRCTGFVRFLPENHDIRPLEGADLDLVRHFLQFGDIIQKSRVTFDVNNRIVVREGPLKGLEGHIVKVDRRKARAKIKLDVYDDSFTIDLGLEILDPSREAEVAPS